MAQPVKRRPPRDNPRARMGKIPAIQTAVTFEAGPGFVTAVIHIDGSTLGLKFDSPEKLLEFFTSMVESAVLVWPDNEFIKMYTSEDPL